MANSFHKQSKFSKSTLKNLLSKNRIQKIMENNYSFLVINDFHKQFRKNPIITGIFPYETVNASFFNFLQDFSKFPHQPTAIIINGDIGPERKTEQQFISLFQDFFGQIKAIFPTIPILPVIGNVDFIMLNSGTYSKDSSFFHIFCQTLQFLQIFDEANTNSFQKGGYYFYDFGDINTRFIILNSIFYSNHESFSIDPFDQFQWFDETCADAKIHNLKIIVVTHIPPISMLDNKIKFNWHKDHISTFQSIVLKYGIKYCIVGHTHVDEIYGTDPNQSVQSTLSLSSLSVSTNHGNNPGVREYFINNGDVIDFDQYYVDLFQNTEFPKWKLEYRFSQEYNFKNIFDLYNQLFGNTQTSNQSLMEKYQFNKNGRVQSPL